jgi:hypothetical protein
LAHAELVGVEYYDIKLGEASNAGIIGGPLWRGTINTETDSLTITYWSEIPGSVEFWIPGVIADGGSVTFQAIDLRGLTPSSTPTSPTQPNAFGNSSNNTFNSFDVPNNFALQSSTPGGVPNMPKIGLEFAFISSIDFTNPSWNWRRYDLNDPSYTTYLDYQRHPENYPVAPPLPATVPATPSFSSTGFFPGWGATRYSDSSTSAIFNHVVDRFGVIRQATELDMPRLLSGDGLRSSSTDATITEIDVPTGTPTGPAVPEGSQVLCGLAVVLGAFFVRFRHRVKTAALQ